MRQLACLTRKVAGIDSIYKAIRKEYGMTVLSITHDLDEVALSDRVLVLKKR